MSNAQDEMFNKAKTILPTPEVNEEFPDRVETKMANDVVPQGLINHRNMPKVESLPPKPTEIVESEFVVFTEVEKDGFVWKPTFRKGITAEGIDKVILLMETATSKFKNAGFTYHETKRGGFPKAAPKLAGTNCQKCGAPEWLSRENKPYCSLTCWIKK